MRFSLVLVKKNSSDCRCKLCNSPELKHSNLRTMRSSSVHCEVKYIKKNFAPNIEENIFITLQNEVFTEVSAGGKQNKLQGTSVSERNSRKFFPNQNSFQERIQSRSRRNKRMPKVDE